jgi:exoribonuclease-2
VSGNQAFPPGLTPAAGSLVVYRGRPARVAAVSDKIEIEVEGGQTQRVRPKDVTVLHPGPTRSLAELTPLEGEAEAAWDLLAGATTDLRELAELIYGAYTPAAAWAVWGLLAEGLLFGGTPDAVVARGRQEVAADRARRAARLAEEQGRADFMARLRAGRTLPEDARYLAEVERLAEGRAERSRLLREIGKEETPEAAHRLLLRLGHWDETANPHPRRQGAALDPPELTVPDLPEETRTDLTRLGAYAIDDDDNQDPDDALSLAEGRLWVHVADVAALVAPGTALDVEARSRGANLYLPERTVPMLPPCVTDRLGLGLQPVSPALSFAIAVGEGGEPTLVEVVRSWVRVTRVSYAEAETRLGEEPFRGLLELAGRFHARRLDRGATALAFPEVKICVDAGRVSVRPLPRLRSRDLVTEAMLMAGEAVARLGLARDLCLPFATQAPPESAGRPEGLAAMFAQRRLMRRTQVRSVPEPHAGLGLEVYTQVTSPLRRYPDLVAHQQLRAWLAGAPALGHEALLERVVAAEAVVGGLRQAERASNRHWTLVYLQRHPEWRGTGILVDKRGPRGTVIVPSLALEAPVHLEHDLPLDAEVAVVLSGIDLPSLSAYLSEARGSGERQPAG